MGLIVFAGAIAVMWVLLAGLVGQMAEKKGLSNIRWYLFSLFCSPLIGYFVVALLPSDVEVAPAWYQPCPFCLRTVDAGIDSCPYCHADLTGKGKAEKKAA